MESANNKTSASGNFQDALQQLDLGPGVAVQKIDGWLDCTITLLTNILLACVVSALFYGVAIFTDSLIQQQLSFRKRDNFGSVLGRFRRQFGCYGFG